MNYHWKYLLWNLHKYMKIFRDSITDSCTSIFRNVPAAILSRPMKQLEGIVITFPEWRIGGVWITLFRPKSQILWVFWMVSLGFMTLHASADGEVSVRREAVRSLVWLVYETDTRAPDSYIQVEVLLHISSWVVFFHKLIGKQTRVKIK